MQKGGISPALPDAPGKLSYSAGGGFRCDEKHPAEKEFTIFRRVFLRLLPV